MTRVRSPIDASLRETLAAEGHLTVDELRRVLAGADFSNADRVRTMVHFGQMMCEDCWGRLKKVAREAPVDDEASGDRVFDPVASTLRLLATTYHGTGAGSAATLDRLRSVHRFWVGNAQFTELGFCRLALEQSRQYALEHPRTARAAARATRLLLVRLPFADVGQRFVDLKALARAYLGDELRVAGKRKPAAQLLSVAGRELEQGTGDRELRATLYELEADLAQARGQYVLALGHLDRALELLQPLEMEGRRAETLVRQGLARLRCGEARGAGDALRQALSEMPDGKDPRLRLEALVYLALAELRSRRFGAARERLAAARALEGELSKPLLLLQAQRFWVEGMLDLETRRYASAEEPLRGALNRFVALGRTVDAAQVLVSLGGLYARTKCVQEFEGLEREFWPLLEAQETRKLVLDLREKIVRWAKEAGVPLVSTKEPTSKVEGPRKDLIN